MPLDDDATLRALFARSARRLLAGAPVVELLTMELPRVNAPQADLLAKLADGGLFHLEFQTTNQARFARQTLRYGLDI